MEGHIRRSQKEINKMLRRTQKPGSATWDTTWQPGIASWNHATSKEREEKRETKKPPLRLWRSFFIVIAIFFAVPLFDCFFTILSFYTFHAFPAISALLDHHGNSIPRHATTKNDFSVPTGGIAVFAQKIRSGSCCELGLEFQNLGWCLILRFLPTGT